jgi:hypothetical protein
VLRRLLRARAPALPVTGGGFKPNRPAATDFLALRPLTPYVIFSDFQTFQFRPLRGFGINFEELTEKYGYA